MVSKSIFFLLYFFYLVSSQSTDEAAILHVIYDSLLLFPKVWEGVDDDTCKYLEDHNEKEEVEHLIVPDSSVPYFRKLRILSLYSWMIY